MTIVILLIATFTVLTAAAIPPYKKIYTPYKKYQQRRAAMLWYQQQQRQAALDRKHREEANRIYKDVEVISRQLEKRFIREMAALGIRYHYRSWETRTKKKARFQYVKIKLRLIGLDYVAFPFNLPQDRRPSDVLNDDFQDNLRIMMNRPDMKVHSTPRDGLFAFIPLRGSADGIPNLYEWDSHQSQKDAMKLLPKNKPFAMPVGLGANRIFHYCDLTDPKNSSAHILVAGTSGGGKSNLSAAWLSALLMRNSPETLRFVMVDLKMVELHPYRNIPHLALPVVQRPHMVKPAVLKIYEMMEERLMLFTSMDARSIHDWNDYNPSHKLPFLFVWIDELALVMQVTDKEVEEKISQLAALGRAAGIHFALFTQRPSVDVVSGLIKTNVPDRVAFNTDEHGSKVILGNVMAKGLTPKGRAIFYTQGEYHSLQTPLIYNGQVAQAVAHAMRYTPPPKRLNQQELWQLMIDNQTTTRPQILDLAHGKDETMTMQRLSQMLWPWQYNLDNHKPIIEHGGRKLLLWHSQLIDVTGLDKLPETLSQMEMLCSTS